MTATQKSFGFDTTHGFLGEEFLLWLWFQWETNGGEFDLGAGPVVGVAIDDMLQFAPLSDDETRATLRNGLPTRTAEARAALRGGHRLAKAKLIVARDSKVWVLTLDGERMTFSGVGGPEDPEDAESAEDRSADRVANWRVLHGIVVRLFDRFIDVRLGEGWITKEAAAMAVWMQG